MASLPKKLPNLESVVSNLSQPKFTLLENDTIELFNRDTLYHNLNSHSWLSGGPGGFLQFVQNKRHDYNYYHRKWTKILSVLFFFFFCLAFVLLLAALVGFVRTRFSDFDDDQDQDNRLFGEALNGVAGVGSSVKQCQLVPPDSRIDCNPDPPINEEVCLNRGCCWNSNVDKPETLSSDLNSTLPPLGVPYCYYGPNYVAYKIINVDRFPNKSKTLVNLERIRPSGFDRDIKQVQIEITEYSRKMIRIRFTDRHSNRYEVPIPKLNLPSILENNVADERLYSIQVNQNDSILRINRATDSMETVFETNLAQLVYSDQFIQLSSRLPSKYLYGLGEHLEPFRKLATWKRYTMLNRDQYPVSGQALYGSHPFYLANGPLSSSAAASGNDSDSGSSEDTNYHGVFLFNSNPMDIITQPAPAITWRTIGGILDFFIFLGPTPADVVAQYQNLIGLPLMPPYWSLGYHLSRFGYRNLTKMESVFERTRHAAIPYDVQWTDIDMMDSNNDFTFDQNRFDGLPQFIEDKLHKNGLRFVPMFDCGISAGEKPPESYLPYKEGLEMNVFIQNSSNQVLHGRVWNSRGSTVWPDFSHNNATAYWTKQFDRYHKLIGFDGAWIDMNEPSNFLDGSVEGCPKGSSLESPAYTPGMTDPTLTLNHKTICMSAKQTMGRHYDVHNLYGLSETIVTNSALKTVLKRRPFIISRSSAPGHGYYGSHWDGDIVSDWQSMKWSISSILNFNLFGIPMVGADICGFNGNTTVELCARWHQLGAFYSFSRNHNTDNGIEQDPVALGPKVIEATRNSLLIRYAHLPYLYTLFRQAHQSGTTVLRPLFFEFLNDPVAPTIETQFFWGSGLMIAPALEPQQSTVKVYFPTGVWYRVSDYSNITILGKGQFGFENAPFETPNVYYRSGTVLPVQKASITTDQSRLNNFRLVVVLENSSSIAHGELYWDSGDSLDTDELGQFNTYLFNVENRTLEIVSHHLGYQCELLFDEVDILGVERMPNAVLVNGNDTRFSYSLKTHVLHLSQLRLPTYGKRPINYRIEWEL